MALLHRLQPVFTMGDGREPVDEEHAIVLKAIDDRSAFAPLYERYFDLIYRHCLRRLGEREAAEDLTGVVFRKALEALHSFHGGSFKAWLFTIANNSIRDFARSAHPASPLDDASEQLDPARGPEDLVIDAIGHEELRLAMSALPPELRQVVELRLDGFSCAEVARILGTGRTDEWVRQNHLRAKLRLRQILSTGSIRRGGAL